MPDRPHDTESADCWCKPVVEHECDPCDGAACYKCDGTCWARCELGEACDKNHVVTHRYPRGTRGASYFLENENGE